MPRDDVESVPMRAETIADAVAERRAGPRREISPEDAFRLAKEERERRAVEGDLADAVADGLPPPILEGDGFDAGGDFATTGVDGELPDEDWVKTALPAGMKLPVGWTVFFIRFRADMTNTPNKGDRTCVVWNLSEMDEKLAARRARGDGLRVIEEMAKGMVRAFDGKPVRWTPEGAKKGEVLTNDIGQFWTEIGGKCRHQLKSLYLRNHTMTPEENADFFESCIASRTAG